jgi:hypothetical protein
VSTGNDSGRDDYQDEVVFNRVSSLNMYVVRAKRRVYHPANQMGHEYITPCGLVVPETLLFDKPQDDFPTTHLVPERPKGRRLCFRCKFVSQAARHYTPQPIDSTPER